MADVEHGQLGLPVGRDLRVVVRIFLVEGLVPTGVWRLNVEAVEGHAKLECEDLGRRRDDRQKAVRVEAGRPIGIADHGRERREPGHAHLRLSVRVCVGVGVALLAVQIEALDLWCMCAARGEVCVAWVGERQG